MYYVNKPNKPETGIADAIPAPGSENQTKLNKRAAQQADPTGVGAKGKDKRGKRPGKSKRKNSRAKNYLGNNNVNVSNNPFERLQELRRIGCEEWESLGRPELEEPAMDAYDAMAKMLGQRPEYHDAQWDICKARVARLIERVEESGVPREAAGNYTATIFREMKKLPLDDVPKCKGLVSYMLSDLAETVEGIVDECVKLALSYRDVDGSWDRWLRLSECGSTDPRCSIGHMREKWGL